MGDFTENKFFYKPGLGASGAIENALFDAGFDQVDARLAREVWVGDPMTGLETLTAAVATFNSLGDEVTLRIGSNQTIATETIVNENVSLQVERGSLITIEAGRTLYLNGGIMAGNYQIFAGSGTVVFGRAGNIWDTWFPEPPASPENIVAAPPGSKIGRASCRERV